MALPPLHRVPALERLLAPGEQIVYTPVFHPLRGWQWLLPAGICLLLSRWWPAFILPTVILFLIWAIPFFTNQLAITTERLLLRTGCFRLVLEMVDNGEIAGWAIHQNLITSLLRCGTVVVDVVEEGESNVRHIRLPWVWHPMSFIEALETLQTDLRRAAGIPEEPDLDRKNVS